MTDRALRRLAWATFAVVVLTFVAGFVWDTLVRPPSTAFGASGWLADALFALTISCFPLVGVVIASRQPRNRIVWLFLAVGLVAGFSGLLDIYAFVGLGLHPGSLPGAGVAASVSDASWVPMIGLIGTFLILLFPDGKLPSPRWKGVGWFSGVTLVVATLAIIFLPGKLENVGLPNTENPLGIEALRPFEGVAFAVIFMIPISIVACAAGLVARFRRSRGEERLQLKWLATAGAFIAVIYLVMMAASLPITLSDRAPPGWLAVLQSIAVSSFALIPISAALSILRYRLYDIDVVINKAVVFAALAAFITLVYVAIVVGIGAAVGSAGRPNLALSVLATAVVAVAFQPVRERVEHFANRLVYGRRATPYEVMAEFSHRMAGVLSVDEILPRMAEVAARGVGATKSQVRVFLPDGSERSVFWPEPSSGDSFEREVEVRHRGEPVGVIAVAKPRGETLSAAEERLLDDLAAQGGLALRNVRLAAELRARLEEISAQAAELRASRQRLVAAQDAERRRLERDIHDGAQQQLVSMAVKLRLAEQLLDRDPRKASEMLEQLGGEANEALQTLRDLARGIFPPLLADKGLVAALEAHVRKAGVSAIVRADDRAATLRLPPEVEAAVYFCCLEALQNAAKHAAGSEIVVSLEAAPDDLRFSVEDRGPGFDIDAASKGSGLQNMTDRVAAVGGRLAIVSEPGRGTKVEGWVPIGPEAARLTAPLDATAVV